MRLPSCVDGFDCVRLKGVLPRFLQEKVPSMMGCEAGVLSPVHDEAEEPDLNSGMKRKSRRSLGGKATSDLHSLLVGTTHKYLNRILNFSSAAVTTQAPYVTHHVT